MRRKGTEKLYIEIRCQKKPCPYGKNCCFGEIDESGIRERARLREKCRVDRKYVIITVEEKKDPQPAA